MKKNILFALIITITILGCSEKEILPCNLETINGKTYNNNKIYSGTCHYYVENNVLWKTLTYKKGKLSKEIAYYIDDGGTGGIEYIGYRNEDGHIDGEFERYYRNGQLELKGEVNQGYRIGNWKVYNEEGDLIEEITYDSNGIPVK